MNAYDNLVSKFGQWIMHRNRYVRVAVVLLAFTVIVPVAAVRNLVPAALDFATVIRDEVRTAWTGEPQ